MLWLAPVPYILVAQHRSQERSSQETLSLLWLLSHQPRAPHKQIPNGYSTSVGSGWRATDRDYLYEDDREPWKGFRSRNSVKSEWAEQSFGLQLQRENFEMLVSILFTFAGNSLFIKYVERHIKVNLSGETEKYIE